jgi:hypothetical protein
MSTIVILTGECLELIPDMRSCIPEGNDDAHFGGDWAGDVVVNELLSKRARVRARPLFGIRERSSAGRPARRAKR